MTNGSISFTIRGVKARVLKLLLGAPLLLIGVVFVGAGASASGIERLVPLGIGWILGLVGCAAYYGAIRSDELTISLGEGSGHQDGSM